MNDNQAKVEALLTDFQYVDSDHDRAILSVGFSASFFFWDGHTAVKRRALIECVEAFHATYGHELNWGCDPDTWKTVSFKDKKLPAFRDYVDGLDEDDAVEWYVASGENRGEVSEYALTCLTERGWMEGQLSLFYFQVPRGLIFESAHKKALTDLIFFCHEKLAPFHGHAGFSAITTEQQIEWEPEELDLATRYLVLYAGESADAQQAPNGIKSINWLTFISTTLTERMGGPLEFVKNCSRFDVRPEPHASGFFIQAEDYPRLGKVDEPLPESYMRVNGAVRPLRNGNFGSMGTGSFGGERRFDRCTSDLWIRRFDAKGIWPPVTFTGLPKSPVGKVAARKIMIKTGDTSRLHGRYRHSSFAVPAPGDDDNAPQVVLLPGDVAPYWLELGPHGEYLGRNAVKWELVAEL